MGKEKYQTELARLFKESPVVSYSSIERIVKNRKKVKQYTKQLVRNLLKKGTIKKLTKGYYTEHDDASFLVFCFKPAYLGLQDALSFHNLWEQETIPIIITTRKIRQGIRTVLGVNVMLRRICPQYVFGIGYHQEGKVCLPYSDIEKTFIDMIYFNEPVDKEVLKNLRKQLDREKLNEYIQRYHPRFKKKVMDYLKS